MVGLKNIAGRLWRLLRKDVTGGERGAALMLVLTSVAIMTAFSVEFAYNMRVSVKQSANMRREVQAYYNARSAMEISRAVIFAQKRFQAVLGPMAGQMGKNLELWRYSCLFAKIFATGDVEFMGQKLFSLKDTEGIGLSEGDFECEIEPEDGKVNISKAGNAKEKSILFRKVYALLRRYFGLDSIQARDREAVEVVLNIIDWVDADETGSDIDESGNVIEGGAETAKYSRYGYEARNAKPDSNEEMRLIEGMDDELYCDIASKLTVYDTEKLNVNAADIEVIKALICEYVQGDMNAVCGATGMGAAGMSLGFGYATPIDYVGELIDTCRRMKSALMMPAFSSPKQFVQMLGRLPEPLNAMVRVDQKAILPEIGTKGRVLRIRTTGRVPVKPSGYIEKRLEAVIDTGAGTFVYWREY